MKKEKPKKQILFSVKYKLMFIMLLVLIATMGIIAGFSLEVIKKDKITYIYDLNFSVANTLSGQMELLLQNKKSVLEGFLPSYIYFKEKAGGEKKFLAENPDIIMLSIWRIRHDKEQNISYVVRERNFFNSFSYSGELYEELNDFRLKNPLNLTGLSEYRSYFLNSAISKDFPVYTMAFLSNQFSDIIIVGDFTGAIFKNIFSQTDVYEAFIVDLEGKLVSHPNSQVLFDRIDISELGVVKKIVEQKSVGGLTEYISIEGIEMLGAYNILSQWGLGIIVETPKNMAYRGARNLISQLIGILLIIMAGSVLLVIFFSRTISGPLIKLSEATKEISEGKFHTKIETKSSDEIGLLARDFNLMTEKLEETTSQLIQSTKMASIGDLSRSIGHEFGNVLTAIIGNTELILMEDGISGEVQKRAEVIIDGAERANMIVQNLKGISRSEEKFLEEVNIAQCIESAILLAEPEYKSRGLSIERSIGANLIAMVDERQISQVFLNMLINAGHAMKRGGKMEVSVEKNAKFINISFKDNGSGIPEENLEKIFEPLFTTKGSSGTGLGLAVSRDIVRDHGGEIRVTSTVGEGATFLIELPV